MADTEAGPGVVDRLKSYVRTRKGTILAVEILLSFIIIICYAASLYSGYSGVAICELVFCVVFFVVFMMELDKQFQIISWVWSDMIRAVIGALLYLITSLICLINGSGDGARMAGGVFGLFAAIIFGYDAYLTLKELQSSRAQTVSNA